MKSPRLAAAITAGLLGAALCGCELFAGRGGGTETESNLASGRAV
ncbi:MAG: hypothetical protein JWM16_6483, partial [Verrucomicrobiales bacterium]|nr:hypothetical protein [Verrucomicrobiales bacterium]